MVMDEFFLLQVADLCWSNKQGILELPIAFGCRHAAGLHPGGPLMRLMHAHGLYLRPIEKYCELQIMHLRKIKVISTGLVKL
jgi:hypothetical protein